MLDIVFLLGGLLLILFGANALTDGGAAIAKKLRVSDLVIGLTIVAFGTSTPELVSSISASIQGSAGLAVGNVVGSNLFNILMIIGCTSLVSPMKIGKGTMTKEIPLVILSSLVFFFFANDVLLDHGTENVISRIDGLVLLCFFMIFLRYTFAIAHNNAPSEEKGDEIKVMPLWKAVLFVIAGLAGLIVGGQGFVMGASGIAKALGVSESVIGLTIVAGGTSLPELATSITAALKKNAGIAIGNVVGSNIFNMFFVLGTSAAIKPLPMGGISNVDILLLLGASILFWLVGRFYKERTITRWEGGMMALIYVAYITFLVLQETVLK